MGFLSSFFYPGSEEILVASEAGFISAGGSCLLLIAFPLERLTFLW